ncbi:hypothetical protein SLEP1_g2979 [Rubroshorea leprosula]|uniref:Uncharacterized protein n=1 Tax=Rubroshorea leprosula TaxID=152421 RepID=A0AAV5HN88_9ROSI|nr:hypothetical protein SLEP1_g2979 [Rubroshorea leprosula]
MIMVMKDKWVRAAMTNNRVVVELLVTLKQAQAVPPTLKSVVENLDRVLTDWVLKENPGEKKKKEEEGGYFVGLAIVLQMISIRMEVRR